MRILVWIVGSALGGLGVLYGIGLVFLAIEDRRLRYSPPPARLRPPPELKV
jgi:hypothetical protein